MAGEKLPRDSGLLGTGEQAQQQDVTDVLATGDWRLFTVYQGMHVNTKDSFPVWVASRKLFPGRNIHRFSLLCRP